MNRTALVSLFVGLTLAACQTYDEQLTGEFRPFTNGTYQYDAVYNFAYSSEATSAAEQVRLAEIARRMEINGFCDGSYVISERQAVARSVSLGTGHIIYTISCAI